MTKTKYKASKKYKCPYCDKKDTREKLIDHIDKYHEDMIPEDYTAARLMYDHINKKNYNTCMICKKQVYKWNPRINRYYNLCDNPECRAKVREIALERHIKVYNKPTLLNDAEHQEKMLANRSISGKYKFSDGTLVTYTGKYEKNALEFMDKVLNIPANDIQCPGPIFEYKYNDEIHTWITDIYYIPANLVIEIKDGGNNPNNRSMPEYRAKQVAKEEMITKLGKFNYIRLTNNNFAQLLDILADIKMESLDDGKDIKIHINESFINESNFIKISKNQKNDLRDIIDSLDYRQKEYIGNNYFMDNYNILYLDIIYKNNNPIGFLSVVCKKFGPVGFIIMAVNPKYQKQGIGSELVKNVINNSELRKKIDLLTWNVDLDNNISEELGKHNGFIFYEKHKDHNEYRYILNSSMSLNEEVGGLPPQRSPEAYIIPYGMNNIFKGFAYGDGLTDDITFINNSIITSMNKDKFLNEYEVGPILIHNDIGNDWELVNKIHNSINKGIVNTNMFFVEQILGRKINDWKEVLLSEEFRYYDISDEKRIHSLIESAILNHNNICDEYNKIDQIDNVSIHITPFGYNAYYEGNIPMMSKSYSSVNSLIESGEIDNMNNIAGDIIDLEDIIDD